MATDVTAQFLPYAANAGAAYGTNNSATAATVNGWSAVKVEKFRAESPDFAAQLYTDSAGHYRIGIRGSELSNFAGDFRRADAALAAGQWDPQLTDAIRFVGEAILQIKESDAGRDLSLDQIRAAIDGSGHSLGGSLWELASKFYGLAGMNIDGPGIARQIQLGEFSSLKEEFRAKGLGELQDNYDLSPGQFQARRYTTVGAAQDHPGDVDVYTSPKLQAQLNEIDSTPSWAYPLGAGYKFAWEAVGNIVGHPMGAIYKAEGYADPMHALAQQNVASGLSANGYAEGSAHLINAGNVITEGVGANAEQRQPVIQITTYKDPITGAMMEARLGGNLVKGTFVATPGQNFVSGMDVAGRVVYTGDVAQSALKGLGADVVQVMGGDTRMSVQTHADGHQSVEFKNDKGTTAYLLPAEQGSGKQLVVTNPEGLPSGIGTAILQFDDQFKQTGVTYLDKQGVDITEEIGKLFEIFGAAGQAAGPGIQIAAAGDGIQTDGGRITGYADTSASNQAAAGTQSAQPAINTEATQNNFSAYLQGPGAELSPAQQDALAAQLDGLHLGGAADLSFHSQPGGGVLISNADGDIVGEIKHSDNGDINLRANSITLDGAASQTSTHITSNGQTLSDSQYTEAQLQSATQSAALFSGLVGLQHWAGMSDVQRLTALSSLYNVADKLGGDSLPGDLGGAAAALSLVGNLERGNLGGTLVSAISLTNALADDMASKAIANALGVKAANVIPGISLALALNSGDPVSMMAAAANFIPGYGPLISIGISLLGSSGLFGGGATPPPPYGEVHFAWSGLDANGQPHTAVRTDANVSGGAGTASQIAGQILHSLQTMVEQANAQTLHDHPDTDPSQLLALNTNLLPSVFWDKDQTSLKLPNPDGATSFFVNLAESDAMSQVVQLLQTNGGIAPQWLVDTQSQRYTQLLSEGAGDAAIERELTAGKSGLVDQAWSQAAAIQGSAGEAADFHEQQFGSLVVHAQDAQVQLTEALKNIDHDAYLERSEWVAASDAQGHAQSLLVIDFNADGVIDTRDVLNLGGNRGQTDARDAQALNANADLQRNNVQWLDANGDGVLDARDPAFAAVKLYMDINADARVQDGEAQGLAQAGITAIDFTAGQVRYADGHSDALTAQLLTGETSGVKLTKVYEVVDGQQVDLHAGDVLESEGYQGQDASGAIRQQTFEHEAVRTGDWEGTAEQDVHRHGGGNGADAPTETAASEAVSQGEFKIQVQTPVAARRTVTAGEVRQTMTADRLGFVPLGAGLNGGAGAAETNAITSNMVQSMQEGLFGSGLGLGALAMVGLGATQAAAQVVSTQAQPTMQTDMPSQEDGLARSLVSPAADGQSAAPEANTSVNTVSGVLPYMQSVSSTAPGLTPLSSLDNEARVLVASAPAPGAGSVSGATATAEPVQPVLMQLVLTSSPLRSTQTVSSPAVTPIADATPVASATWPSASEASVLDYPVVQGETLSGSEDVMFRISGALLVRNDSTPNAPANPTAAVMMVTAVGNAVHGRVSLVDGEVVFVPEADFYGTASFEYTAADQYGLACTATATLEVLPVNDAPAAMGGEEVSGEEELTLIIEAAGLLQNDRDVDNPHVDLRLSRVQSGTGGTVSLDADGNVVFTPDHDFYGDAAFTYWVIDAAGLESSPATARVVVAPVNDAPGAQGETVTGASEDAVFNIPKSMLLANDHDVDDPNSDLRLNWVGNATGGAVSLDASGNVVFTPTVNFNGYASFSYTVRDAAGLVSPLVLASIPVAAVNDAPLAVDDQFSTYRNSTMSIGFAQLTSNDSDVEADALTVSAVRNGASGEVSIVNGKVQFVPTSGFSGAASFDYLADDGQGGQTWATAVVNVIVPPQYPTVNVTLGSSWVDVYHGDAANLRQTFNYSFDDEKPATVSMTIQPNFGAGFTYAGFGNVQWVTATDFNIYKYDVYGNANISLNLNLTDESGLTNTAHVYVRYSSLPNGVSQFQVWHDHTGYATPVVLDLDGQGLQAVATKDSNVTFDVDGDGLGDRMAWVGAGNGVLALDIDGNGKISDAKEFVFKQYVAGAQTDLEGLAAFDSNRDAKLDTNDELFAKFGVWQDKNADGIQDADEYQTLAQLGIASIDLRSDAQVQGVNSEVVSFGSAQFTRADGSAGVAYDAMLAYQSGADQAAALLGFASLEDAIPIPVPNSSPAAAPGDADVLNANAIQMALLFNQMCNTAPANDPGLLGFVPIEADPFAQNWNEVVQTQSLQLQAA